jgi:hypothetical protein
MRVVVSLDGILCFDNGVVTLGLDRRRVTMRKGGSGVDILRADKVFLWGEAELKKVRLEEKRGEGTKM